MYCPDNYDQFERYEEEQERSHKRMKRIAHEWGEEEELPFVSVPQDNGDYPELY